MRDECCKTWNNFDKDNLINLNENNQCYYFYFHTLYEKKINRNDKIEKMFNGIKKYISYYKDIKVKDLDEKNKVDNQIKEHITEKFKQFIENKKISLDFALLNMKNMVNKIYKTSELSKILYYCPLKYFIVEFDEKDNFKVKMAFPFLKNIIITKLNEDEINKYFIEEKYLKSSIVSKAVKGDYFESSVKIGLNKNIELPAKIKNSVTLEEIITMETIKDNYEEDNDEIYNYEEEEDEDAEDKVKEEKEEIFNDIMDENTFPENNVINSNTIKNLFKKFSININAQKNEKDIEKYRRREIRKICEEKKDEIIISKVKYDGNKNYFIDQRKKQGRLLDYAILYGEKQNKSFIGLQMKCYFKETKTIADKFVNKMKIKAKCQHILFQSMLTFDCKITNWYYYLIFCYNPNKPDYSINNSLLDKYKYDVGILLYNPIEKKFYDCNKNDIKTLELNEISDLDKNYASLQMNLCNIEELPKIGECLNSEETKKYFVEDFEFMKCNDYYDILKKIAKIMHIGTNLSLRQKIIDVNYIKLPPQKNIILLYKKKNKGFLGIKAIFQKNKFQRNEYYDLEEGIRIDDFYSRYDDKYGHLYSLFIKRNYNALKEEHEYFEEDQKVNQYFQKIYKDK